MRKSCGFITNIAPLYVKPLWLKLTESLNVDYVFFSSRMGFADIKTIDINESKSINSNAIFTWFFIRNIYLKQILFYQIGATYRCMKTDYDAYIINGEAQCISNWFSAIICRIRNKPVLFWGHGIKGNENRIKKAVRILFYKLADYHLIYGNRSRVLMIKSGFDPDRIYTVYNSLDFELHRELYASRNLNDQKNTIKELFPNNSMRPIVIFIGRLTRQKKISYLLEAISLCKNKGIIINCLIIGGGSDSEYLIELSNSLDINELVCFFGPCYDERINAKMIMMADCCVSPGNVGLTAIHSLSLGTPVITHDNLNNQGPEVEAIIENETGLFFEENNVNSLSVAIENLIFNLRKSSMESHCLKQISEYWNQVKQAAVFDEVVIKAINENS